MPQTEQKQYNASFFLEVIQYVQYLQETVQKYEGSNKPLSSVPSKLMPWGNYRNSQWRAQSFPAKPQALKNGTDAGPTFSGWFDENLLTETSSMQENQHNPLESHPGVDDSYRSIDIEKDVVSSPFATSMPIPNTMPVPVQSHSAFSDLLPTLASDEWPSASNALNNQEFVIKDGTTSISNTYSKALLDSFTQALETSGLDLSQTTLSVQIKIGKQPFKGMGLGPSVSKDTENPPPAGDQFMEEFQDTNNDEELE
ncbi:hypothetical protein P3S67_030193 [Capsicum chacoense]